MGSERGAHWSTSKEGVIVTRTLCEKKHTLKGVLWRKRAKYGDVKRR